MTSTETYSWSIANVQYPTITICPVQDESAWNFPRLLLNQFKFRCQDDDSSRCGTQKEFFKDLMSTSPGSSLSAYFEDFIQRIEYVERNTTNSELSSQKFVADHEIYQTVKDFFPYVRGQTIEVVTANVEEKISRALSGTLEATASPTGTSDLNLCLNFDTVCDEAYRAKMQHLAKTIYVYKRMVETNLGTTLQHFFEVE